MTAFERAIRVIAYVVIALFIAAFFIPFVGITLFEGFRRNPRALIEFAHLPGCWLIIAGPLLCWTSLMAFYFRLPKEVRTASLGTLGASTLRIGGIVNLVRQYRRRYGFDWLLWTVTLSGVITAGIYVFLITSAAAAG
ncbi:MAG: hypothetical protein AABO58_19950 [Acidobacteriota bacterium]